LVAKLDHSYLRLRCLILDKVLGDKMRVAVIGGGPSGLVTLKYLLTAHLFLETGPIEARIFEGEADIGGTFLARTYEDAEV
jgi:dimethylaniline monooxygenase (N-oxide forming)